MIIIRYREISLKGKNRKDFEQLLRRNIKSYLKKKKIPHESVERLRGRIVIRTEEKCPELKNIFGIASFSYIQELEPHMDKVKEAALALYKGGSFRITCQRGDKVFGTSIEIAADIGAYIVEKTGAQVDLHNPGQTIYVEFSNDKAYLYSEKIPGPGGLPINPYQRVALLLQNEDSVQAGIKVMRRGCSINVVKENDIDWSDLHEYEYGFTIDETETIPDDIQAVVVSDTVDNIREYPYFVLRPLIK